jgi:hypothetical protein
MSDIYVKPMVAKATMRCDKCDARWESAPYEPKGWRDEVDAARPAFEAGWTLYNGARSRRVYCPEHGPTTPMLLMYGRTTDREDGSDDA